MKRKFKHYAINVVIRMLCTLVIISWLGTVIHLITM